ncbi:MAG: hypothetical protein GX561_05875 [Lentisphaerae bacterium]|nr:hypothetical protein [Lentisphaerota bacterium]
MRIHITFLLFTAIILCANTKQPQYIWFNSITKPSAVSPNEYKELALKLHKGIKEAEPTQAPYRKLAENAPNDNEPRIVFISIGDDLWPCRTYIGTGFSLKNALENALEFLQQSEKARFNDLKNQIKSMCAAAEREKTIVPKDWLDRNQNPNKWDWLKIDVVQCAKESAGFQFNSSKLALTSLAGIAFSPSSGFAFTPAQITGRCLLNEDRFIAKQQVGNFISETLNFLALKNWMELSAQDKPLQVTMFEVDSYWTDGTAACQLYRGHQLPKLPATASECLEKATDGAKALLGCINPKSGEIDVPFPDWFHGKPNGEELLEEQAELVIALARLATATKDPKWAEAAKLAFKPISKAAARYGQNNAFLAIIEDEELPQGSPVVPRKFAHLKTNALTAIAMDHVAAHFPEDKVLLNDMKLIAAHLLRQTQPNGGFVHVKILPSEKLPQITPPNFAERIEAEALATFAIYKIAERLSEIKLMELADKNLDYLVQEIKNCDILNLHTIPWLAETLVCHYRGSGEFASQLKRMAVVAEAAREGQPIFADTYGSVKNWPSMTAAANYSWLLATLGIRSATRHDEKMASELLKAALPFLVFQTQAQIDMPTASALSRPAYYVGFFRDHLDDFGFELKGQATQIISLLKCHDLLNACNNGRVPEEMEQAIKKELDEINTLCNVHPSVTTTELVLNDFKSNTVHATEGRIQDKKETPLKDPKKRRKYLTMPKVSADVVVPEPQTKSSAKPAKPKKK